VCRVGSKVRSRDEPSKLTIKIFKCMTQKRPISKKKEKKNIDLSPFYKFKLL
jgi:hypothetical protein